MNKFVQSELCFLTFYSLKAIFIDSLHYDIKIGTNPLSVQKKVMANRETDKNTTLLS